MNTFEEYLQTIENEEHRAQLKEVLDWVANTFPTMEKKIGWKQPMFTNNETYIVGFSVAKNNYAIGVEKYTLDLFRDEVQAAGYDTTSQLIKVKWNQETDYKLLEKLIAFNIKDKEGYTGFWRK